MAIDEHKEKLFQGPDVWNAWRKANPEIKPDLSGIDISGDAENIGALLSTHKGLLKIGGYDFTETNFKTANLSEQLFVGCKFSKADLTDADIQDSHFYKIIFSVPSGELYKKMDIHGRFDKTYTDYVRANQCIFENTNAYNTVFEVSSLNYCDLLKINIDESTEFKRVGVIGTKLSIDQLETLENCGGLSSRRIGQMNIIDDLALLRDSFSGIWNTLHISALLLFLLPYLWFVGTQWVRSNIGGDVGVDCAGCGTILGNLTRFIASGGHNWREFNVNGTAVGLFLIAISVNLLRLTLFIKTKQLEHRKSVLGFHRSYVLSKFWRNMLIGYSYIGFIGILVAILNTLRFLLLPVPI